MYSNIKIKKFSKIRVDQFLFWVIRCVTGSIVYILAATFTFPVDIL